MVQFFDQHGSRQTIRLGKLSPLAAREIRQKVEYLNAAAISGCPLDNETATWLARIGPDLFDRLARVELVVPRQTTIAVPRRLGDFVAHYIAKRTDAKPRTRMNLKMFGDRLAAFFGADKDLTEVKRSDADEWVRALKQKYKPGTIGRTIKGARQIFKAAVRAELIRSNPFEDVKAGSHPDKDRQQFITLEETQRVIEACPDSEWQLIVALSRYGGLRCPSEHLALTWPDVDWARARFLVHASKTEHHEHQGERWVPIFPELRPYLEAAFERADDEATHVIVAHRKVRNWRTRFTKIIHRAGLIPWPKLFQNLRASRQTELSGVHPLHVVCDWLGNSPVVAHRHYLQTTEEDFARASGAAKCAAVSPRKRASRCDTVQDGQDDESSEDVDRGELMPAGATPCNPMPEGSNTPGGIRTPNLWLRRASRYPSTYFRQRPFLYVAAGFPPSAIPSTSVGVRQFLPHWLQFGYRTVG
jgi:integrase